LKRPYSASTVFLLVFLTASATAGDATKMMSVQVRQGDVRATPYFLGKIVATLSYGDRVEVLGSKENWFRVSPRGKGVTGWMHASALSEKRIVLKAGGTDAKVAASSGELALAGKGFNAFAAPGGLIFVFRGMLRCCRSEDAVAAVLAHEIAHIQLRHGIRSIEKGRQTQALTILAAEGAKTFGKKELADLTRTFEGSIIDITSTLINNGYSRTFEQAADASAVRTLSSTGYNPNALVAMLREMEKRLKPGGLDFAKTHPSPRSRIEDIESLVGRSALTEPPARQARFRKVMENI